MPVKIFTCFFLFLVTTGSSLAQDEYADRQFQFLSYEKVPTWTGLASGWNTPQPVIHLFDSNKYRGHADFASQGLKTGISFKQFKEQVRHFNTRQYLPFFLYDLRKEPMTLEGKKYTWALMLEDYAYEDQTEQMAGTVLKLMQLVRQYIGASAAVPNNNNGIIILSTNPKTKPNTSSASLLGQKGFAHRTLHELNTAFNASKTSVLNKGLAYGYLRYVKAGQEDSVHLSPNDVVIYENMPARVPPVSGIITLEPQTPLSHINLLAKNRNTINLYASSLQDIPGLAQRKNKLVKIDCSEKKILVTDANLVEAKKFWTKRLVKISIPAPLTTIHSIINLGSVDQTLLTVQQIGAKASNYAQIQKAFPKYVRPGFALSFHWYFKTIRQCGADTLVTELVRKKSTLSQQEKENHLQKIRDRILQAHLDTGLLRQVKKLGDTHFPGSRIRLRSSTNCEDLPEFNGAGLYLSKGYNTRDSIEKLEKKILQVYASLWSVSAFIEREFYFIDHTQAGMAILINEAYSDELANGVVLTIPHQKGYSVFINTQVGDELVTNPENGQVPEALLYRMPTDSHYVIESRSSIKDIFLSGALDGPLEELKQLALDVQKLFDSKQKGTGRIKYGVDIEFRVIQEKEKFKLYIKQARLLRQTLPE